MSDFLKESIILFNQQKYFEAHEKLEDYWNTLDDSPEKKYVQGFIQICAAKHLLMLNRKEGARKVLARAEKNLCNYKTEYLGIDLNKILLEIK